VGRGPIGRPEQGGELAQDGAIVTPDSERETGDPVRSLKKL
jgi:hypothetical protein